MKIKYEYRRNVVPMHGTHIGKWNTIYLLKLPTTLINDLLCSSATKSRERNQEVIYDRGAILSYPGRTASFFLEPIDLSISLFHRFRGINEQPNLWYWYMPNVCIFGLSFAVLGAALDRRKVVQATNIIDT